MKYIGKYGEYRVLACLLERDIEAYQAIKANQADYDLTAILESSKVVRIQVKSTELNNKSTNNSIKVGEGFEFLVAVIFNGSDNVEFYVMSRCEALCAKGTKKKLSLTHKKKDCQNGGYSVTDDITEHKNKWNKIKDA